MLNFPCMVNWLYIGYIFCNIKAQIENCLIVRDIPGRPN
jgi:hypothetical protein